MNEQWRSISVQNGRNGEEVKAQAMFMMVGRKLTAIIGHKRGQIGACL